MTDPIIKLDQVEFRYGSVAVLKNITLEIREGEFLGIVGPNAGGKSTLLKIIMGMLEADQGSIRIKGQDPSQARKYIGYVPQYPTFDRDFPISVEQVVLLGLLGSGFRLGGFKRRDRERAVEALRVVECEDLLQRQIGTLSGGQLQRVLLARALVSDPEILILDEPTANIDQRVESDIFDLLKQLNREKTILVVSHDIAFISSYVDRVACLNRTLVCHHTDAIDGEIIKQLYGENVRMVAHHH